MGTHQNGCILLLALLVGLGCGGTADSTDRMGNLSLSGMGTSGMGHSPNTTGSAHTNAPLVLADGASLVGVDALTRFETDPVDGESEQLCAVYSLRASRSGFAEGRETVTCPAREVEFSPLTLEQLAEVEPPRARELSQALQGAQLQRVQAESATVLLRVTTDRGTIEGTVASVTWPHPSVPEPAQGRPPNNLGEVWEAVLHPHRYAAPEQMTQ